MSTASLWTTKGIKEVVVYRSLCNDVYQNLALEDWIFNNIDIKCRRILLLWRNNPCVVIGRHQNPWMESNLKLLQRSKVKLARRRSGGGAVYHDQGNLNCTLFSSRHDYQRTRNLQLACDAINNQWNLNLRPTERGDIVTQREGLKVSGSAAKLAKHTSYHHFTLLIDVNKDNLRNLLRHDPNFSFPSSRGTASVPSPTINLSQLMPTHQINGGPRLSYKTASTAIATHFYHTHHLKHTAQIHDIDPSCEDRFPGINQLRDELASSEWLYNKTPSFTMVDQKFNRTLTVSKGIIIDPPSDNGVPLMDYLLKNTPPDEYS